MINIITQPMAHQTDALLKFLPSKWNAAFMDMGTGKSLVAIMLAAERAKRGKIDRVLWFTPVSLKDNIRREINKHTDSAGQTHVFNDKTTDSNMPDAFWHVIGLESMGSSNRTVLAVHALLDERTMVIIDESGYIKGHRAKRTRRVTLLSQQARYRLIMTGTPISQGIEDLFAQFYFLSPKILGYYSFGGFANNHLTYSDKYPGRIIRTHNTEELAHRIKPYTYQITKKDCLNLPQKVYSHRYYELTLEQHKEYDYTKEYFLELLEEMEEDSDWMESLRIFRLFAALQQIVSGHRYHKPLEHNRLRLLLDVIGEIAPNEQIIIWAKYHWDIKEISQALAKHYPASGICEYHGKLSIQQRNQNEQRFHQGAKFFIGTPSSGGHGLTLTESAYVIFYSSSFKYADRIQAEDRAHRIGQTRPVTYISLWCICGIEDRIYTALERKADTLQDFRDEVDAIKEQEAGKKEMLKKLVKSL